MYAFDIHKQKDELIFMMNKRSNTH